MDPNANLAEQDVLVNLPQRSRLEDDYLRELRHALRAWLTRGGFEPTWTAYPVATQCYRDWAGIMPGMFRPLAYAEAASFQEYARTHAPDLDKWSLYHPACREEWTRQGKAPIAIPPTDTVPDPRD